MAALVLSVAGAAAGKAVFGPAGAIAGRLVGALAGNAIDRALFGSRQEIAQEGPRLADLEVMASTEGAPIPRVYGRARLPGQVIWATNLEEVVSTTSQTAGGGGKGMGGGPAVTTNTTTYSYLCQSCGRSLRRADRRRAARLGRRQAARSHGPVHPHLYGRRGAGARSADRRQGRRCAGLSWPCLCRVRAAAACEFRQPYSAAVVRGCAPGRPA